MDLDSLTSITQARLIRLRWLSVLAMSVAALASPSITGSTELLPRLMAAAVVMACFNAILLLASALGSRKMLTSLWTGPTLQLVVDFLGWTVYLYLSGGAGNPLITIFLPLVAIGAIALPKVQAWTLTLLAIVLYTVLWHHHEPLALAHAQHAVHVHLLGMWVVFAVSAIVVTWFTSQMTRAVRLRDAHLAQAREQALRDDWLISMGSLAAGAAHDLSTPLATLSLLVEDSQRHPRLPAELQGDMALMQRQIAACKQALAHLTQRAGSPRGGEVAQLPVAEWLGRCVSAWQALHPQASVRCTGLPAVTGCQLPQDLLLERAIASLLDNAAKAQASQIELRTGGVTSGLLIEVLDDGVGFPPEVLENFQAGQPSASEKGLGIGLLLAKGTLERRGGSLQLHALPERGSCARVFLPF